ncbi:putative 60S ribosomal protein L34 [Hibiscus syriacus]|uniref:60S ribosomal protein L34 n=1 Tax=Hibiscus syriacus TaxID=106335 RepID=A0A6A2YKX7_HIBSY|nr:putative 60S ribosomal protein L34 [Hibiscus syriacus]
METKPVAMESKGEDSESTEENESPNLFFKFQYQTQTFEELRKKFEGNENFIVGLHSIPCTSTNKYEFKSENDICCIMEKPEDFTICVKEFYADSSNGLLSEQDFLEQNLKDLSEGEIDEAQQSKQTVCENVSGKLGCSVSDTNMDSTRKIEDQDIKQELRTLNKDSNALDNSEESNLENPLASDSEDSNSLETLWEHQELLEQLKMEMKKIKATGLPTILEESEYPKIMDDLKPWKIDEKFQYADRMTELHKFYKSYRGRMRKFDILNYQKMYAIGLLHSKDPFQSISTHKSSSAPAVASLLPQKLRPGRRKTSDSDPMSKFINELQSDLEMVYVGQMCLSWEILHWQYQKAIEIWESDPYCLRRNKYNEVAGEFQQFQVLIQRFIENEPFEGPRVQSYIKKRFVVRNLLQVPVIRENSLKDKRNGRRKERDDDDNGVITADVLLEMMEESIRIFLAIHSS